MNEYMPEGFLLNTPENIAKLSSKDAIFNCIKTGEIVEAPCMICDSRHNLIVDLGEIRGIIPREEGALGITEGYTKDIALISRVNKPVCFIVKGFTQDEFGKECALLSRREAQERCRNEFVQKLSAGDVISARVTHLEQFGCFVDIGCGIPSLIPIDLISVSRISHPSDRFSVGMDIKAVVKALEGDRIFLSHKELLGTWLQNAQLFENGETVTGIARSIEEYGVFVELTPNLAGLAEPRADITVNRHVSVYIKAIIPEKMKVKLIIVNSGDYSITHEAKINYFINSGHIDKWVYSTENSQKIIETDFTVL